MKTFEEKWTAWIDGQLDENELAEFKASLPDVKIAELEKEKVLKLGNFLRKELGLPKMANEEFFHHQLRTQIETESARAVRDHVPDVRASWWSIGRLAWAGAASLAIFAVCTFFVMRDENVGGQSAYLTQIVNARINPEVGPDATITMFESKEEKATVLWVDGFESLPADYAAK